MRPQPPSTTTARAKKTPPSFNHYLLHIRKTFRLIGSLIVDRRVPFWRKGLFATAIIVFGVLLFIPDSVIFGLLATLLPIAAPIFQIPAGLIDIAALAAISYGLLAFFPKHIVQEHAVRLYGDDPDIRPHSKAR